MKDKELKGLKVDRVWGDDRRKRLLIKVFELPLIDPSVYSLSIYLAVWPLLTYVVMLISPCLAVWLLRQSEQESYNMQYSPLKPRVVCGSAREDYDPDSL